MKKTIPTNDISGKVWYETAEEATKYSVDGRVYSHYFKSPDAEDNGGGTMYGIESTEPAATSSCDGCPGLKNDNFCKSQCGADAKQPNRENDI